MHLFLATTGMLASLQKRTLRCYSFLQTRDRTMDRDVQHNQPMAWRTPTMASKAPNPIHTHVTMSATLLTVLL